MLNVKACFLYLWYQLESDRFVCRDDQTPNLALSGLGATFLDVGMPEFTESENGRPKWIKGHVLLPKPDPSTVASVTVRFCTRH